MAALACGAAEAGNSQTGIASIYWEGTHVATGARFHPDEVLCAHKTLPLHSTARVTNLQNGRSIICPILDRGPFNSRVIDLSRGAARALGVSLAQGLVMVRVDPVG